MKKIMTVDGNEACSKTAYLFTELSAIYPITPSSPMAEHIDEWSNHNELNLFNDKVKVIEMQSEAGAAGMMHGALQAGILASTFTASQGLLLMIPNMYKMAGEMLPAVIHVAARSLSTHALSIFGDHQDIYLARPTGVAILSSSSPQDASYLSALAHLSAIKSSLPFMHFFDGFRTSHEINKIEYLEKEDYEKLLDYEAVNNFRKKALNLSNPVTRGTSQNDDIYFQMMEARNTSYNELPDIVNNYMEKINKLTKTDYKPFNYYGSKTAKKIIIAMGSVCETIKEVIDDLGYEIGLIEVHLYRPFSEKYFKNAIPATVEKIAVLDRTKEPGSTGEPLYLDVVNILKEENIKIVGGRYGLSSKNTTPAQIKAVYDMLDNPKNNFTIGIEDDVTNLSLKIDKNYKIGNALEILIYGYGSDGMVSSGKSLISMIGENTNKYVQGYFEYDSKKSGGVTIGHLRFKDEVIRKPYYVDNPSLIVISKDTYLNQFELFNTIKKNGTCLIETSKTEEELINVISDINKKELTDKNIKIYTINASSIARKNGLNNKISMIMEMAIVEIFDLIDKEIAYNYLVKYINDKFLKKGENIVVSNIDAIKEVRENIKKISLNYDKKINIDYPNNIYEMMNLRKGNELKVSSFLENKDGTFIKQHINKNSISEFVPSWISNNCIMCNQCSFVCPHGVIRPYLLNKEEYEQAPIYVKERCIKSINPKLNAYYYLISVAINKCTGCGVCIKTCPGKNNTKALIMNNISKANLEKEQEIFDYVSNNITNKKEISNTTVIGSQFEQPSFAFCGACAGCGETAYIKILTQLFKNQIVIANATGCSSIYGGSTPDFPYDLPWASSLFEDNAEYGYGILMGNSVIKNRIDKIIKNHKNHKTYSILNKWLEYSDDYEKCKEIYEELKNEKLPDDLETYREYLIPKIIWTIGGDGWAYDIGFGGIDHVLSTNDDVNILVLDSQVYSNTGGQSSKASPTGSIASFATSGKVNVKKDLARMLLAYPHVYVSTISLGANMVQVIKAMKEAASYKGPSIIIAYTPCISHGIEGGMENSVEMEKQATECGYYPIFRYNPITKKLIIDSKEPNFDLYDTFLKKQTRYKMLEKINHEHAQELLKQNKEQAIERYNFYKNMSEKV